MLHVIIYTALVTVPYQMFALITWEITHMLTEWCRSQCYNDLHVMPHNASAMFMSGITSSGFSGVWFGECSTRLLYLNVFGGIVAMVWTYLFVCSKSLTSIFVYLFSLQMNIHQQFPCICMHSRDRSGEHVLALECCWFSGLCYSYYCCYCCYY